MYRKTLCFISNHQLLPVAVLLFILSVVISPNFVNEFNMMSLLTDTAILGFLVLGETLVILTGGIDLSVGNVASMSTVIATWSMIGLNGRLLPGANMVVSIIVTLLVAGVVGLATGIFVTYLRVPPLIASLGAMWVARGIAFYPLRGIPTGYPVSEFSFFGRSSVSFIPVALLILLVATFLLNHVLTKWGVGRSIYAVGGNAFASYISGINVKLTTIGVYAMSGVFAGIGGILLCSYSGTGYPRSAEGYELFAIAAVVMGGVSLSGGEGKVWNTLLGVFILRMLNKMVVFNNISGYIEGIFIGTILLLALWLSSRSGGRRKGTGGFIGRIRNVFPGKRECNPEERGGNL